MTDFVIPHLDTHLHIWIHFLTLAHTYTFGYTCSHLLTLTHLDTLAHTYTFVCTLTYKTSKISNLTSPCPRPPPAPDPISWNMIRTYEKIRTSRRSRNSKLASSNHSETKNKPNPPSVHRRCPMTREEDQRGRCGRAVHKGDGYASFRSFSRSVSD